MARETPNSCSERKISSQAAQVTGAAYPGCDLTTIGPNPKTDEEDNTGMACHIFAASDNGPRGTGGLSPEEPSTTITASGCATSMES